MEERKIIKFGNSSYVITLPSSWLEKNNLNKGDPLLISTKPDSILISVKSDKKPLKEASINMDDLPLKIFNRKLISYYLKNYNKITLTGEDLLEKIEQIKVFKEKLSSIEITKLSSKEIILKDLTSQDELNIQKLIDKIIDMETVLFEEIIKEDFSKRTYIISQIDKNINKLTFLTFKAINYNLEKWENPQEIKDSNFYWRIVVAFEQIGDILKRISRYIKAETKTSCHHVSIMLNNLKEYFFFITNLLKKNIHLDNNLKLQLDKKQSLLKDLEELREKMKEDINLYLVVSQLIKDIIGQLDVISLSVIDLNTK